MSREEILKRLNEVFQDVFDNESFVVEEFTSADDIEEWDSLEHINLIVAIESEFSIKFAMDEVSKMKNVSKMIDIIQGKV